MTKIQKHVKAICTELENAANYIEAEHPHRHITIFGSARTQPDTDAYKRTFNLAKAICNKGHSISTGAGSGIMGAASAGGKAATAPNKGEVVGYSIALPFEELPNENLDHLIDFDYFNIRKWFLISRASAIICAPSYGVGTQDELFEALTLIQTKKISRPLPIVLFGTKEWQPFVDLHKYMLSQGSISPNDMNLFFVTDDIDEAIEYIENKLK